MKTLYADKHFHYYSAHISYNMAIVYLIIRNSVLLINSACLRFLRSANHKIYDSFCTLKTLYADKFFYQFSALLLVFHIHYN